MLAWIRSPRGSTTTATAVAAILALFWLAPWQKPLPFRLPFVGAGHDDAPAASGTASTEADGSRVVAPGPNAPNTPATASLAAPSATTRPGSATASLADPSLGVADQLGGAGTRGTAAGGSGAQDAAAAPSFDVVRVEPTGDAVIAGRATPNAEVALLDGDRVVAHMTVDGSGQFALLPPALPEGSHYLTLRMDKTGQAAVTSAQGVAVTIAKAGTAKPLVALLSPDKPAQVLSDGSSTMPAPSPAGAKPAAPVNATPVSIQAVEAAAGGRFTASGVARAGSQCRVYLNGAYLADVTAGKDGHWSVEVKKGMKPGRYTVRADELEGANGKVVNRAEVPFDYPAMVAGGGAKRLLMARGAAGPAGAPPLRAPATASPAATVSAGPATAKGVTTAATGGTAATTAVASAAPQAAPVTGSPPTDPALVGTGGTQAIVANLNTATVIRGDSLWRISRKMLGHGIQYTEIYATNVAQIRNPKLIYPGQVFVVPNKPGG